MTPWAGLAGTHVWSVFSICIYMPASRDAETQGSVSGVSGLSLGPGEGLPCASEGSPLSPSPSTQASGERRVRRCWKVRNASLSRSLGRQPCSKASHCCVGVSSWARTGWSRQPTAKNREWVWGRRRTEGMGTEGGQSRGRDPDSQSWRGTPQTFCLGFQVATPSLMQELHCPPGRSQPEKTRGVGARDGGGPVHSPPLLQPEQ